VSDAGRLVVLCLLVTVLGLTLQLAAFGRPRGERWLTVVGLAPAAGVALVGVVGTGLAVTGVGVGLARVGIAALLLCGLGRVVRRPLGVDVSEEVRTSTASRLVEAAFLVVLLALSGLFVRLLSVTPLADWDGWAIWGLHAEALYVDGGTSGPVFDDPLYAGHHPEYPVLFPVLQALASGALGRFDPTLIHVVPAVVPLVAGLGVWGMLRMVVPPPLAALSSLGVAWAGPVVANLSANYADAVLAAFVSLGLVALLTWLARSGGWALGGAALFLSAAGLTKTEGLLFVSAAVLGALAAAGRAGRPRRPLALASALALGPGLLFRATQGGSGEGGDFDLSLLADPGYLADNVGRTAEVASALVEIVSADWRAAAALVGLALAAAVAARLAWPVVFLGVYVAVSALGLVATYTAAVVDLDWLIGTSLDRVALSLVVAPALAAPAIAWLAVERSLAGRRETVPAAAASTLPAG
jgi:hypothetical protein